MGSIRNYSASPALERRAAIRMVYKSMKCLLVTYTPSCTNRIHSSNDSSANLMRYREYFHNQPPHIIRHITLNFVKTEKNKNTNLKKGALIYGSFSTKNSSMSTTWLSCQLAETLTTILNYTGTVYYNFKGR